MTSPWPPSKAPDVWGPSLTASRTLAAALGRFNKCGEKAFEALSRPGDSGKPGKLALALAHKTTR